VVVVIKVVNEVNVLEMVVVVMIILTMKVSRHKVCEQKPTLPVPKKACTNASHVTDPTLFKQSLREE
jgi:hypothetical protein